MKITKEDKDTWAVISAFVMLGFSVLLTAAGFILPPTGEIHDSVLYTLAQCLFYSGSIFGITSYTRRRFEDIERRLRDRNALILEDEVLTDKETEDDNEK